MGNRKQNNQQNSLINIVLKAFTSESNRSFTFRQLSNYIGIHDEAGKILLDNIIDELKYSGTITVDKREKMKLNPAYVAQEVSRARIVGIVDMKSTGKAYIISDETDEDVFISQNNTKQALHGDKVKVLLLPKRKGKKLEGKIEEVIERVKKNFVGTIQISKKYAFLVPDSNNMPYDIYIPVSAINGAKDGQKAVAEIRDWPKNSANPFGKIVEVLGEPGENNVEMNSILLEFDLPIRFPKEVEIEAEKIDTKISKSEIEKRRDFRNITTLTIDPKDAKDFDDALSIKTLGENLWEIGVHIADVSHYVKEGSIIDDEAYKRATSVYLVDRVVPMLPERLSNELCSLRPNEEKLTFSAVFQVDEKGNVKEEWFGKTIICSDHRFTYEEAQEVLEGNDEDNQYKEELLRLNSIARNLRETRFSSGSIEFTSREVRFELDDAGKPLGAFMREQKDSNKLVEEFMLLANKKVAEFVGKTRLNTKKEKTFVYRIHDLPKSDRLQKFSEFLQRIGYKFNVSSQKKIGDSFNQLFHDIAGKGESRMIETIALRTMSKAIYSSDNIGHYGLSFKYYSHFTSPIRRYPDVIVHRLLEAYLKGAPSANKNFVEEQCLHCSKMEVKSVDAERTSVKYKQAEYMMDKVGKEFNGVISGVSKWGLFVELRENYCEGMVSIKSLADDFYYLDDENYSIIGQNFKFRYKLGDEVRIVVKRIDLHKKQLDFELV